MNKDNEYRENAAECERMARLTRDNTDKRTWLDMAQHWRSLISVPPGGSQQPGDLRAGIERAAWRANGSPLAPNPPAFKFPVKPRALAMTTQGVEKRRKSQGPAASVTLAVAEARGPLYVPKLRNKSSRLSIDLKTRKPEWRVEMKRRRASKPGQKRTARGIAA